jgi:hypothetical protein
MIQSTLTKTILSLCDYSGTWSAPYRAAGYDVLQVDLQHGQDVRTLEYPGPVHGILAAPPCRVFCRPGARLWEQWGDKELCEGLSLVDACLRFVAVCQPRWWVLENPPGRLDRFLGPPSHSFHPWEYGDAYTKHTYLWGRFTIPARSPVEPEKFPDHLPPGRRDRTSRMSSSHRNQRSETPQGFAAAFFEANR